MQAGLPWIVMPVVVPQYTETAISDCLAQSIPCRILIVNQGVETSFRERLERIAEDSARVFLWSHEPPLPSLSATWNCALDAVWEMGATEALVVNNDVRLAPNTLDLLRCELQLQDALFVSAVGVREAQFTPGAPALVAEDMGHGGPDFSCFLISRDCHALYRFDEHFVPAYCEDLDFHRRLLLDGKGDRIFSVNLPYLHYAAGTLNSLPDAARARITAQVERGSRVYYAKKWGGPVNQERYREPFDEESAADHCTTPELHEEVRRGQTDGRVATR